MSIDKLIAEDYQPIDAFSEHRVPELQIRLTQAQAVIAIQEQLLERAERKFYAMRDAMIRTGVSIDAKDLRC